MRHRFGSALVAISAVYGLRTSISTTLLIRRLAPQAAAGEAEAVASVTQTPYARAILGIPNSDLATAYYAAILILRMSGALYRRPVLRVTRAVAWSTVGFSAYLIHALFFRLHQRCPVCMRAHAANLVMTLALQFLVRARD